MADLLVPGGGTVYLLRQVSLRLLDMETWNRYVKAEAAEQFSTTDAVSAWRDLSASTA